MAQTDRRVQRTRELLQTALLDLLRERSYEAITVQDIVEYANVGRSTFYLHYSSKDELFLSCHEAMLNAFQFGPFYSLDLEELLSAQAPAGMTAAYRHLAQARPLLASIFQGKDGLVLLRRIRDALKLHDSE